MARLPCLSLQKPRRAEEMVWALCWGSTEEKGGKISFWEETRVGLLHRHTGFVGSLNLGWGQPVDGQCQVLGTARDSEQGRPSPVALEPSPHSSTCWSLCACPGFCVALAHFAASKSSLGHLVPSSSLAFSLPLIWSYLTGRAISPLNTHGAHHEAGDSLSVLLSDRQRVPPPDPCIWKDRVEGMYLETEVREMYRIKLLLITFLSSPLAWLRPHYIHFWDQI